MKYLLSVLLLLFTLGSCVPEQPMEQAGSWDWEMVRVGEKSNYPARVPGCVHTDLLDNGLIEDPYFGDNEADLQWIGETSWKYVAKIIPDPWILEKENIELVFEGLDTYAEVYLNDSLILTAYNMFRIWKADVKDILHKGENHLAVIFFPTGEMNDIKADELSYKLPDKRAFTRKSPYHFGWDWGPEFVTCGIWKPVYLEAWDDFRIDYVHVEYASIDDDPLPLICHVTIESDLERSVRLQIFDEENGDRLASEKVELKEGKNEFLLNVEIEHPEHWWPAGLGEQKMYTFRVKVLGGGKTDETLTKFGIREIELIREPDEYGEAFYFVVNGLPVFMKGANYVPQDNFLPRVDTARYEKLIESVVDANMNMLRVWGGGFYENDIFYDLCDKNGILVWQDFMFACNMYPGDEAFLENIKQEAIENVKRLANHPCIALWCGNNEIDEGWHNWGWQKSLGYSDQDSAKVSHDYQKVFHDILPSAVEENDPGTIYWPSSPMTGWGRDEAYTQGDVHYWGVWWGEYPFWMYKANVGRFVSEYGFQGMPPIETIESFTSAADRSLDFARDDKLMSDVLESHQKHPRGTELIQKYMERDYIVPEEFEDYVYVSQVLQAEGMGQAFYTHRITQPYCMGTLYWQLNDCWPVTSWSGLDYYGRWKALHYHVKRAYANVMVHGHNHDGTIYIFLVNDLPEGKQVTLQAELMDLEGHTELSYEKELELPPMISMLVDTVRAFEGAPEDKMLVIRLKIDDEVVSRSFQYYVPTKDLSLPDPGLNWEVSGKKVVITAEKLARQVFLEARGLDGRFSDNFFDMAAGETRSIRFTGEADAVQLTDKLIIRSIYDTYN